jgi:hypothetical protein
MADPMKPSATLLVKLGSALVHADELTSPHGHDFDRIALRALIDREVKAWAEAMNGLGLLPVKRHG